ncbi:Uncharacterized protein LSUE1_G004676 [Lachnellula suecica]|uniref:NAD(P)-binding protein n=1 Tax=Lachnellula suecica TaxID=602035 RepID=A0A8T9C968_9HELO|nr:Uncharacterized protein LSUE1_G004676 [Lachnellula suecica]
MQPVTILSDDNVKQLLHDLRKHDVEAMMSSLETALHQYSLGTGQEGECSNNQPERITVETLDGNTTQFMPSMTTSTLGIKGEILAPHSFWYRQTLIYFTVVTVPAVQDDTSSDSEYDAKSINPSNSTSPRGALTILSSTGEPTGFVNAEELTAFRTALTSSLLLVRRSKVKTLTVFGCGKQAYWHVRLALLLHGSTIKHIHFINRDFSSKARDIMKDFYKYNPLIREREGWSHTDFSILTPYYEEYARVLKDQVRAADVIFCTTASTEPLFDHSILTNTEGRQKGRLIVAVGSYKKSMIEIPREVIAQAVKRHGSGHHLHKRAQEGGAIVVDTIACAKYTGELSQANIQHHEVVELGELVMLEHMPQSPVLEETETLPRASLESLSLGSSSPSFSRSFSFKRRSSTVESGDTTSGSSTSGHHSLSNILPKIFHKKDTQHTSSPPASPSIAASNSTGRSGSTSTNTSSTSAPSKHRKRKEKKQSARENEMSDWLSKGNVVYKSIGLGLTDLVVGGDLVQMARERGVGVTIERF